MGHRNSSNDLHLLFPNQSTRSPSPCVAIRKQQSEIDTAHCRLTSGPLWNICEGICFRLHQLQTVIYIWSNTSLQPGFGQYGTQTLTWFWVSADGDPPQGHPHLPTLNPRTSSCCETSIPTSFSFSQEMLWRGFKFLIHQSPTKNQIFGHSM